MTEVHKYSQWLDYANDDLKAAKELLKTDLHNIVCFHSQQAVEKALKAYLVFNNINPPQVHNLITLLELCINLDKEFEILRDDMEFLDSYYIPTRYPSAPIGYLPGGKPNKDNATKTFEKAENSVKYIIKLIEDKKK